MGKGNRFTVMNFGYHSHFYFWRIITKIFFGVIKGRRRGNHCFLYVNTILKFANMHVLSNLCEPEGILRVNDVNEQQFRL